MPGLLTLPVACAALVCGPVGQDTQIDPVASEDAPETPAAAATPDVPEAPEAPETPSTPDAPAGPSPAKLVEFDGGWEFLKMSRRMRVWRAEIAYEMKVDPEGHPTDCSLVEKFRKNYINIKLCEVLIAHHTFEPARDAQNTPVPGVYRSSLSYVDLREQF